MPNEERYNENYLDSRIPIHQPDQLTRRYLVILRLFPLAVSDWPIHRSAYFTFISIFRFHIIFFLYMLCKVRFYFSNLLCIWHCNCIRYRYRHWSKLVLFWFGSWRAFNLYAEMFRLMSFADGGNLCPCVFVFIVPPSAAGRCASVNVLKSGLWMCGIASSLFNYTVYSARLHGCFLSPC